MIGTLGVTAILDDLAVGQMTVERERGDVSVRLYTEGDRRCEQANAAGNNTGGAAHWMYRVRGAPTDPRARAKDTCSGGTSLWSEGDYTCTRMMRIYLLGHRVLVND